MPTAHIALLGLHEYLALILFLGPVSTGFVFGLWRKSNSSPITKPKAVFMLACFFLVAFGGFFQNDIDEVWRSSPTLSVTLMLILSGSFYVTVFYSAFKIGQWTGWKIIQKKQPSSPQKA